MNKVSVIGLDLAKNVFQVHVIDYDDEVLVRKLLTRPLLHLSQTNKCILVSRASLKNAPNMAK